MDTQKYKLHWTVQVIAYLIGLFLTVWLAYYAGQASQPLAYTVLIMVAMVFATVIRRRFTNEQNPYT